MQTLRKRREKIATSFTMKITKKVNEKKKKEKKFWGKDLWKKLKCQKRRKQETSNNGKTKGDKICNFYN